MSCLQSNSLCERVGSHSLFWNMTPHVSCRLEVLLSCLAQLVGGSCLCLLSFKRDRVCAGRDTSLVYEYLHRWAEPNI